MTALIAMHALVERIRGAIAPAKVTGDVGLSATVDGGDTYDRHSLTVEQDGHRFLVTVERVS